MLLSYSRLAIRNLALKSSIRRQYELDKTLDLEEFVDSLIEDASKGDKLFHGTNKLYNKEYPRTIRVAPSIKEMLELAMSVKSDLDNIDNSSELSAEDKVNNKLELLKQVIQPKQVITIDERPNIWWGDTLGGINGRVGYVNNDRSKSYPFKIGGTNSHICAGGNTGFGKSVMMDAFIQSLLVEYPPWELGLFMVDMKMLEHAKYGSTNKCPQIRNIGITGSSTYITTVLEFVDQEMKDFYSLCAIVGSNTLAGVREALNLSIPRCLVIMDEFSQLNENATNAEKMRIEFLLQSIVKLGRAVGYHLLPTSQTFRGAISKDTLGQFKVGMAVGSNDDNSEELIGNVSAVALKEKVGYCIINQNRGIPKNEKYNSEYKVAFLDVEKAVDMARFQKMLERVCRVSDELGIHDKPSVFNEKTRREYKKYIEDIEQINRADLVNKENETFMNIVLGSGMVYSDTSEMKIEYISLNYERNSNLFVSSKLSSDTKYILKLIGKSIDKYIEDSGEEVFVKMIVDNPTDYYRTIVKEYKQDLTGLFNLEAVYNSILKREMFLRYNLFCESSVIEPTFIEYIKYLISNKTVEHLQKSILSSDEIEQLYEDDYIELTDMFNESQELTEEAPEIYRKILDNREYAEELLSTYQTYMNFSNLRTEKYMRPKNFKKNIFFFFEPQLNEGISNKYGINESFNDLLSRGPSVGVFSIVIIHDPKGLMQTVKNCGNMLTGSVTSSLENSGLVQFLDKSGVALKYTKIDGDISENKYFKKYLYRDNEFLAN